MPQHDRLPVRRSHFDDTAASLDEVRTRRHRRRFDDADEPAAPRRGHRPASPDDGPVAGDRWSTWDDGPHGPTPHPDWLVTELAAVDTELGVLKTGKEADVHLVERAVPGTSRCCLLAAKRYRSAEHRMFHRDAGYLEGRRVRRSRETRAMARRTASAETCWLGNGQPRSSAHCAGCGHLVSRSPTRRNFMAPSC